MNHFLEKFGSKIRGFWEISGETEKQKILNDILQYANSDSQTFIKDIKEIRFDKDLLPLPIVLEALSTDTANWGQFYVDLLDDIFDTAKQVEKPKEILSNLMEFAYIEKDDKAFVQRIADRLIKELDSDMLETKLAAIWILPSFLKNKVIRNRNIMVDKLQQLLMDKNWKVRVITFKALGYEDLLPLKHKLSLLDKLLKMFLGVPRVI
jgi:hypothetical protein